MDRDLSINASVEEESDELEIWPPPEAQVRSALWRAEGHIERGEYVQAARTLDEALRHASDPGVLRGLRHLAAAGYRAREGDEMRARRQLDHARRRLAPYLPVYEKVELDSLIELVAADLES
jgi:hypothetical protein